MMAAVGTSGAPTGGVAASDPMASGSRSSTTSAATSVVCEETSWGLVDHDEKTDEVTGLEIWNASTVFPADMLERLPSPGRPGAAAA